MATTPLSLPNELTKVKDSLDMELLESLKETFGNIKNILFNNNNLLEESNVILNKSLYEKNDLEESLKSLVGSFSFKEIGKDVQTNLINPIKTGVQNSFNFMKTNFTDVLDDFKDNKNFLNLKEIGLNIDIQKNLLNPIKTGFDKMFTPVQRVMTDAYSDLKKFKNYTLLGIKDLGKFVGTNVMAGLNKVDDKLSKGVEMFEKAREKGFNLLFDAFLGPLQLITKPLENFIGSSFADLFNPFSESKKFKGSLKRNKIKEVDPGAVFLADQLTEEKKEKKNSKLTQWLKSLGIGPGLASLLGTGGPILMIASGLIWGIFDAIKGFFLADEWGVDKISASIGAFLGGTGSDIGNVFKNAGKWALIGAGTGFLVGGPIGGLVGGLIGAVFGGLLGWIGGQDIAKLLNGLGDIVTGKFVKGLFGQEDVFTEEEIEDLKKQKIEMAGVGSKNREIPKEFQIPLNELQQEQQKTFEETKKLVTPERVRSEGAKSLEDEFKRLEESGKLDMELTNKLYDILDKVNDTIRENKDRPTIIQTNNVKNNNSNNTEDPYADWE